MDTLRVVPAGKDADKSSIYPHAYPTGAPELQPTGMMTSEAKVDLNFNLGTLLARQYLTMDKFEEFEGEEEGYLPNRVNTWKSVFRPQRENPNIVTMTVKENPDTKHLAMRFSMSKKQLQKSWTRYEKEDPYHRYPFLKNYSASEVEDILERDAFAKSAFLVRPQTLFTLLGVLLPVLLIIVMTSVYFACPHYMKRHFKFTWGTLWFFDLVLAIFGVGVACASCRSVTIHNKHRVLPYLLIFYRIMTYDGLDYIFLFDWLGDSIDTYLGERIREEV